jgi:hypothetical protein
VEKVEKFFVYFFHQGTCKAALSDGMKPPWSFGLQFMGKPSNKVKYCGENQRKRLLVCANKRKKEIRCLKTNRGKMDGKLEMQGRKEWKNTI